MDSREDSRLLLGVTPLSDSSSMHFLLTGPSWEGLSVIEDRERRVVHSRLVGEDEGDGENDKFGTGICIEANFFRCNFS